MKKYFPKYKSKKNQGKEKLPRFKYDDKKMFTSVSV